MMLAGIVPVEIAIGLWLVKALPGLVQLWLAAFAAGL